MTVKTTATPALYSAITCPVLNQGVPMPDIGNSNIEIAHHLREHEGSRSFAVETVEIAEAILLAIVAVATAWSGYQAARWSGYQSERYGQSSRLRVEAEEAEMTSNQERLYIAATVAEWLKAEDAANGKLAAILERRILPEFRPAFEAWKKSDPVNNVNAPAGPLPLNYQTSKLEEAMKLNRQAAEAFERGNEARRHSDEYVRVTVILATVLLLVAVGQRFKLRRVRMAMMVFAALLLCFSLYTILWLPRT